MRNVSNRFVEKIKTYFVSVEGFFPPGNGAVYDITWKNVIETDRSQMSIYYGACALHAGYLRL